MTPHEQIIAKHRQTAVDLRIEAEGKRSHAKGFEQTARELDMQAEAHEAIAELAERAIMGAVADQAGDKPADPLPECTCGVDGRTSRPHLDDCAVLAWSARGAGDIHEPDARPWCVAVVGRFGTIHENDFATEEEAQREYLRPMPGCTTILRHNGALQTMRYDDPEPDEARPLPPPWGLHPRRRGQRLRRVSGAVDPPSLRPEDVEHDGPFPEPLARPEPCSGRSDAAEPVSASPIAAAETAPEAAAAIIAGEEEPRLETYPRDLVEKLGFGRQKVEAAE